MMPFNPDPVQRVFLALAVAWSAVAAGWSVSAALTPVQAGALVGAGVALLGGGALARSGLREARTRRATLERARQMLQGRLSDHLHLLLRSAAAPTRALDERERARLAAVVTAAREVDSTLDLLSEATLRAWEVEVARAAEAEAAAAAERAGGDQPARGEQPGRGEKPAQEAKPRPR